MNKKYEIIDPLRAAVVGDCMYAIKWRWSSEGRWCIFIALNPSTTEKYGLATNPTVLSCKAIAEQENCGGMILLDLFPYAVHKWDNLAKAKKDKKNIMGKKDEHEELLEKALRKPNALIIMAWGDIHECRRDSDKRRSCNFRKCFENRIDDVKKMINKHAGNNEIKFFKNKGEVSEHTTTPCAVKQKEKAENEEISHPLWLTNFEKKQGKKESDKDYYERVKEIVLKNYVPVPCDYRGIPIDFLQYP